MSEADLHELVCKIDNFFASGAKDLDALSILIRSYLDKGGHNEKENKDSKENKKD